MDSDRLEERGIKTRTGDFDGILWPVCALELCQEGRVLPELVERLLGIAEGGQELPGHEIKYLLPAFFFFWF